MTKITCEILDCNHNKDGECQSEVVSIGTDSFYMWCRTCNCAKRET